MQSGPLLIPGQPRFANHFDHPQQPGPIPQDQIGIAVQPGVFGQGQRQGQGPFGQLSIPGQPKFSNQNGPILSPQPGSNDQLGPFGMGVPGSNLFQPQKPWVDSVNWQLQLNKQLNEEIAKKIREMLQNKTTGVPQMMTPISVPQNAWAPFPQNQWANRFHRSPLANLQALQAQGYQIIKLKDYQNLERRSASGPGGAFSKLNIRSDEKTSDKKSFGGSLAQNSTLNSTESFTDNVVANMRAASSSEHMIVGNPLEICKDYEIIDQHHPSKHNKEIKSFCKNFYQNVMPSFPSYPNEVLSTSHSEDYTVTDDISKMSDSSIRNLTQTRQQLPNNQQQKTQSDGQSKRFGDNFIGLSEELAKNSTNATAAPVQYRYRPSVNGNLPQQIPATIRANPPPKSTPRMNNYNSFHHPLAVGSALYKLPSLWPGNASNNNYNNKNFMNFAPVYPITPPNNYYLQKFPVYQTPNYFLYQ
ncbi:GSCOCG00002538001-RA-CDS [Cotesia congregata]|nr:GSCOCG00002538001-RA-CDS [Cotesia congregata]